MFDYVNEYLRRAKAQAKPGSHQQMVVPQIRCAKGLRLSIQASRGHHCEPKDDTGPWETVEVLVRPEPDRDPPRVLLPYRDIENLFAFVPVSRLNNLISHHGGIVEPFVVLPPIKVPLK